MSVVFGLVPGHGGIHPETGAYTTAPAKMHKFDDGLVFYEGVENRILANLIIAQARNTDLEFVNLIDRWEDVPLRSRIGIINRAYDKYKKEGKELLIWELHHNWFRNPSVRGAEVFTTTRRNFSDDMATEWAAAHALLEPKQTLRTERDGVPYKEKNFFVIDKMKAFGCLIEFYFFSNREEVDRFKRPREKAKLADTVIRASRQISRLRNQL